MPYQGEIQLKHIVFFLRVMVLAMLLHGLSGNSLRADPQVHKLYSFEFMPFSGEIDGSPTGLFIDIVESACSRAKLQCIIQIKPWRRALKEVEVKGGIAGVFPIGWNRPREGWLQFSPPLYQTGYGFFQTEDSRETILSLEDWSDHRIGTFGPSNTLYTLRTATENITDVEIEIEANFLTAIRKAAVGRYGRNGALYGNIDVVNFLSQQENITNLRLVYTHQSYGLHLGFPRNYDQGKFARSIETALLQMRQDGELR